MATTLMRVLKPRQGFIIRDPVSLRLLPPEGQAKPWNRYWHRRVKDGDCLPVGEPYRTDAPKPAAPAPAPKTTPKPKPDAPKPAADKE